MRHEQSHGGLGLTVALSAGIPATIALALGFTLAGARQEAKEESRDIERMTALAMDVGFLDQAVSAGLAGIQAAAAAADATTAPGAKLDASSPLLHVSRVLVSPGLSPQILRSIRREGWDQAAVMASSGQRIETEYLAALARAVDSQPSASDAPVAFPFRFDPHGRREWLAVAFPAKEETNGAREFVAALSDPMEAFAVFANFGPLSAGGGRRAYLLSADGNVVAHSGSSYVGADFTTTSIFQKALAPLFAGKREAGTGTFTAIDQIPAIAAYRRAKGLPLALVLEETLPLARAQSALAAGDWRRTAGQGLGAIGLIWLCALILGAVTSRRARRMIAGAVQAAEARTPAPVQAEVEAIALPRLNADDEMERAIQESVGSTPAAPTPPAQAATGSERDSSTEIIRRFEVQARLAPAPSARPALLAECAAKVTGGPVLYFRFHRGIRAALLQAHAGFGPGEDPGAMSFPVFDDDLARVHAEARAGTVTRLQRCEPLAKLVLARLGVAHFEAWAITGYTGPAGPTPREPALLGILVAVQAGSGSAAQAAAIQRLIRVAGGILEADTGTKEIGQPESPHARTERSGAQPGARTDA
ncbi:MAG: hypothetical protein IT285_06620 [Bdellovibrionales bacterium]|nr:hypothetical protein [Bdellovibrionales bacterium]